MISKSCRHNQRTRYTDGFYCDDCGEFFTKDSREYRSSELLFGIYLSLHNANVERNMAGLDPAPDIVDMLAKISINKTHTDYESLISEAEAVLRRHCVTPESSELVIKGV